MLFRSIKTTQRVDVRSCAWQLSLYERLAGVKFDRMFIFHLREEASKIIEIERIPEAEIDRLLECERNGEIYHEPGLVVEGDLIACVEAAERELKIAEEVQKKAKEVSDGYRQKLYEFMTAQGIKTWETLDKSMQITRVDPYTKQGIDGKRLRAEHREIAEKYTTISQVKGTVKITIREA